MVKDSGEQSLFVGILFRCAEEDTISERESMKPQVKTTKKDVIAYRKSCQTKGTGLSHYILMDKKAK
jgi:modified peptide precursor CbpA